MSRTSEGPRHPRRRLLLVGVSLLLGTVALAAGPPAAAATESGENVTVYRATNATFDGAESVEAAIANGSVEPADTVVVGDDLLVVFESERFTDAMNATSGTTTARFFAALDGEAEFRIVQTNPTPERNRKIAVLGRENVTVYQDGTTVYAVVETGNLSVRYRVVDEPAEIRGGDRFAVQFGYDLPDTWSRATVPDAPVVEFQTPDDSTTSTTPGTTTTRTTPQNTTQSTQREPGQTTSRTSPVTTDATGVPGFTPATALVSLLALAVSLARSR